MTGISRGRWGRASWLRLAAGVAVGLTAACGGRARSESRVDPSAVRVVPLAAAIVLETAGPPPSDTSVTFTTGEPHVIVLRHGPPENVVFAEVSFPPGAFRGKVVLRPACRDAPVDRQFGRGRRAYSCERRPGS